jgi:poly(A) polymerase
MGRPAKDIDIATSALPDQVLALFPHTIEIGKAFGVIGVVRGGQVYEVATFRTEDSYSDGRRPDHVRFCEAREDARRRDFTINALFYDPESDRVIDEVGGLADLERRVVRTVGPAADRFAEDHLRMLRAVRFATTLDFELDPAVTAAIQAAADRIRLISPERIRDEISRMLTEALRPGDAIRLLQQTGLLAQVLPEIAALDGVEQPPEFHPEGDVLTHTCLMLNLMGTGAPLELALMVLLHDIGKPPTAAWGTGADGRPRIRFDGHDRVGADMAAARLAALRFPNRIVDAVVHGVRWHMRFMHVREMRRAKLRAMVGAPGFGWELELHRLDCLASHGGLENVHFLAAFQHELAHEPLLPEKWVRGEDVMVLGVPPGPAIGEWLRRCYERQLEGEAADRESLLRWLAEAIASDTPD